MPHAGQILGEREDLRVLLGGGDASFSTQTVGGLLFHVVYPPDVLAAFSRRYGITFPSLSDLGSATIAAYGILDTVADEALGSGRDDSSVLADVKKLHLGD